MTKTIAAALTLFVAAEVAWACGPPPSRQDFIAIKFKSDSGVIVLHQGGLLQRQLPTGEVFALQLSIDRAAELIHQFHQSAKKLQESDKRAFHDGNFIQVCSRKKNCFSVATPQSRKDLFFHRHDKKMKQAVNFKRQIAMLGKLAEQTGRRSQKIAEPSGYIPWRYSRH